jgi:hypothetical protein
MPMILWFFNFWSICLSVCTSFSCSFYSYMRLGQYLFKLEFDHKWVIEKCSDNTYKKIRYLQKKKNKYNFDHSVLRWIRFNRILIKDMIDEIKSLNGFEARISQAKYLQVELIICLLSWGHTTLGSFYGQLARPLQLHPNQSFLWICIILGLCKLFEPDWCNFSWLLVIEI